jgi:hypothetical protein
MRGSAALLAALCSSCQLIVGTLAGALAGGLVAGPPGAAAGGIGGFTAALVNTAGENVARMFGGAKPPPPGSPLWSFLAISAAVVAAVELLRYVGSPRYREGLHRALRKLLRVERALQSEERAP